MKLENWFCLFARRAPVAFVVTPIKHRMVENAVHPVIGLTRVLMANIKQAIEPNTPVMTFRVTHTATIINRFSVDQDGKTPMRKARGTTAN